MAVVDKRLCAGTLSNSNATLYTAPSTAGSYVIVKAITLCNKTATAAHATIKFDGVEVIYQYPIAAKDTVTIPFIDHIIEASELIEGSSGTASAINYYISGKEVA
jgi:hypothetical protein